MSVDQYMTLPCGKVHRLAYGLWKCPADETTVSAVKTAIGVGYRHIDGGADYGNEKEMGEAIRQQIQAGVIKREDVFVTTKLWNNDHQPEKVKAAFEESRSKLGLDYVDLYLIHYPMAFKERYTEPIEHDFLETWSAMEKLVDEGLVKDIGVSNFNKQQLERLLKNSRIKPANLQIEIHPYLPNIELVEFAQSQGVTVTAYSPFASPDANRLGYQATDPKPLLDERIKVIASKIGKTPAQVILRWILQRNLLVAVKSVTPARIHENFNVFDFTLSEEDMKTMSSMASGFRVQGLIFKEFKWTEATEYPF